MKTLFTVLFAFVAGALASTAALTAQSETIPLCTDKQLEDIEQSITFALDNLDFVLTNQTEGETLGKILDYIAIEQRGFSLVIRTFPHCAETYIRGYRVGQILDNYAIAYGMMAAAELEALKGNTEFAEILEHKSERNLIQAAGIASNRLPDIYEKYFVDGSLVE